MIIVVASIHAFVTHAGTFPYNVAKAGIVAMVQSFAIEWGPRVRAVGIAPGWIGTESVQSFIHASPEREARHARHQQMHPVGRIGRPEDIGALCTFLASPLSSFISGSTLHIDGGLSALVALPE